MSKHRLGLLAIGHLVVFAWAYWMAFSLRFDFRIAQPDYNILWLSLFWVAAIKLTVFYLTGHCHGWWSHVAFADLVALVRAAILSFLLIAVADYYLVAFQIPRVVLILDCALTILVYGALRACWRMVREQLWRAFAHRDSQRALLIGASRDCGVMAHHIHVRSNYQYRICGFLAINGEATGSRLGQIPVLGHYSDVRRIAVAHSAKDILLNVGHISGQEVRRLMEVCKDSGLTLRVIPPMEEVLRGNGRLPVREVEIADLLQRDPVELDSRAIGGLLEGRCVLVTGAGGSIGAEICRQVLKFQPRELVLLGRGENRIFATERELLREVPSARLHAVVANVTDRTRMAQVFDRFRPQIVIHAAGHKHVPLMECNVGEAIKNNVLGTKCVADLADEHDSEHFVFVSSDKAVNPTSVMGATKQLAERYVQDLSQRSLCRFVVVRFGNVLDSAGSVVPIFRDQIRDGGPLTVTDPRMTRFFMTMSEASQLVLQAAAMGSGGETFVLEMGEPVRIIDLARDLIRLSGLPENAVEIVYTGIRPGEKLHEDLHSAEEAMLLTSHPKILAARRYRFPGVEVNRWIDKLSDQLYEADATLRARLAALVPGFASPNGGRSGGPLASPAEATDSRREEPSSVVDIQRAA